MTQASMRPPEFTGGNHHAVGHYPEGYDASMRPPEFTGGNIPSGGEDADVESLLQ